ncbi:retrovirus-related pol polyprotein from transposon TNT 1-94, partial [Tanacetum coccineum]
VKHPVKGAQALCSVCNECLFDANHAMCLIDHVNSMNVHDKSTSKKNKKRKEWKPTGKVYNYVGYKWKPTERTFTLIGNACPLTRITATNKVPLRVPIPLEVVAHKHVVTRVYTRRPKVPKSVPISKPKVVQIVLWYLDSGCSKHMTGDHSQLTNFVHKFLDIVKFGNNQVAKIMGYGDYQIRNVTISRVYYVEGLGHNLFSIGQFYDSDLEDLDSQGTNLCYPSIGDMMVSSPICLLSKATKTKSWLWHRRMSHLNFGALNHLARNGLVRGLPRLKFEKDNFVNEKKYILVIVDDYSRFTWVKFLASKDEAPGFIIKFLKMIQVRLNAAVRNIRTVNETEFVNQTLQYYYEQDIVFQPVFDVFFSPPASVASPFPVEEAPAPVESTGSPSIPTIDQDTPSPSTSQTTPQSQSQTIPLCAEEESHDLEVAHMSNDPYFGIPIPEPFLKNPHHRMLSLLLCTQMLQSQNTLVNGQKIIRYKT